MSPSARQIEREVEASRANLEETVEALKGKMSLGQMVDEAAGYFKDSGGGEAVANLGRQIRDNPLPVALVGLGLAWLMSGRGQPHISSRRDDVYETGYDPDFGFNGPDYRRMGRAGPAGPTRHDFSGHSAEPAESWSGTGDGGEGFGDMLEGAGESLTRAAHDARDAAAGVASGVRSAAGAAAGAVGSAASGIGSAASHVRHGAYAAGDAAWSGGSHAYRGARRAYRGASHVGSGVYGGASRVGTSMRRSFYDVLENEPLVIGALGLAVGAAIGALLPRTRTEDRYLGDTSDQIREAAEEFGKEKLEQGKAVADEVYRTAKEKAEETGLTGSGQDSLAGKVGEVARATIEKAQESAADAGLVERNKSGDQQQSDGSGDPMDNADTKRGRQGTV